MLVAERLHMDVVPKVACHHHQSGNTSAIFILCNCNTLVAAIILLVSCILMIKCISGLFIHSCYSLLLLNSTMCKSVSCENNITRRMVVSLNSNSILFLRQYLYLSISRHYIFHGYSSPFYILETQ